MGFLGQKFNFLELIILEERLRAICLLIYPNILCILEYY